jgi:hypothetical protein
MIEHAPGAHQSHLAAGNDTRLGHGKNHKSQRDRSWGGQLHFWANFAAFRCGKSNQRYMGETQYQDGGRGRVAYPGRLVAVLSGGNEEGQ